MRVGGGMNVRLLLSCGSKWCKGSTQMNRVLLSFGGMRTTLEIISCYYFQLQTLIVQRLISP